MWAAVFPGQGSQHVGMGEFLYCNFPVVRNLFAEANETLSFDFQKLCFSGPSSDLELTENTQPALLLVSIATLRALQSIAPVQFKATAGHSIGEYAALVAANALDFTAALKAVRTRGLAMQSAVPVGQGGMLAVLGMDNATVDDLCVWAEQESGSAPLTPANFNAPGQVVISGQKKAIDWLLAQDLRIRYPEMKRTKLIPLKVSAPFHCPLMKPAEDKMREVFRDIEFRDANFPIIQNVHGEAVTEAEKLKENLILQVSRPVRWVKCVETLAALGISRCVELGAGKVIAGLIKKIDSEHLNTLNITSIQELRAVEKLFHAEGF